MGDRGNIVIKDGTGEVWLYAHSTGGRLPATLRGALARQERWDDAQYLARIVFCRMLGGDSAGATGFGISPKMGDGGYSVLVVDTDAGTVGVHEMAERGYTPTPVQLWPMHEYIAADREWVLDESTDGWRVTDAASVGTAATA